SMDFSSMPSLGSLGGGPQTVNVRIESEPPGAEAKSPTGAACRTPCSLALSESGTSTVSFSLEGYQPQAVPVTITAIPTTWDNAEAGAGAGASHAIDPNPVVAVLDPVPPPPPQRRRSA